MPRNDQTVSAVVASTAQHDDCPGIFMPEVERDASRFDCSHFHEHYTPVGCASADPGGFQCSELRTAEDSGKHVGHDLTQRLVQQVRWE